MFRLLLRTGHQAFSDGRIDQLNRERVGVIVGNLALPSEHSSTLAREYLGRTFEENLLGPDNESIFPAVDPLNSGSSMMSPTVVTGQDGTLLVLGTGGANRIRSALTQVISAILDHGLEAERAVRAPRIHFEAGVLNAEVFSRPGHDFLESLGAPELVRFDTPNLFFGGVHMVERSPSGEVSGAGDPRRAGVYLTV